MLHHNLDVMHVEKNIFENVIRKIMNIEGIMKDSLNTCLDLEETGIRNLLHSIELNRKIELPLIDENRALCPWVKNLEFRMAILQIYLDV